MSENNIDKSLLAREANEQLAAILRSSEMILAGAYEEQARILNEAERNPRTRPGAKPCS